MKYLLIALALFSLSCTEAQWEKATKIGDSAKVKCYSGGIVIYEGESTGAISSEENSDGYYFKEKADGKLKEVSGNCVLSYE